MPRFPTRKFPAHLYIENLEKCKKTSVGSIVNSGFPEISLMRHALPLWPPLFMWCDCHMLVVTFLTAVMGSSAGSGGLSWLPALGEAVMVTCAAMTRRGRQQVAGIQPESVPSLTFRGLPLARNPSQAPPPKATHTPE